jgi:hypothetical protein
MTLSEAAIAVMLSVIGVLATLHSLFEATSILLDKRLVGIVRRSRALARMLRATCSGVLDHERRRAHHKPILCLRNCLFRPHGIHSRWLLCVVLDVAESTTTKGERTAKGLNGKTSARARPHAPRDLRALSRSRDLVYFSLLVATGCDALAGPFEPANVWRRWSRRGGLRRQCAHSLFSVSVVCTTALFRPQCQ